MPQVEQVATSQQVPAGAQASEANDGGESSGEEVTFEEYFLYSARCGEIEGLEECLNERVPIDYQNAETGNTALHQAAANGQVPVVQWLLEHGAQINLPNSSKNTPLHWACLCGQLETVKLLCEWFEKHPGCPETQKADCDLKNAFKRKPMEEALQSGKSDIAEYLAPRTVLEDDKTYSTIHESQIYQEEDDGQSDEEEKKSAADCSMQSEEAIRPDDYQRSNEADRQE